MKEVLASVGDFELEGPDAEGYFFLHNCFTDVWWMLEKEQLRDLFHLMNNLYVQGKYLP